MKETDLRVVKTKRKIKESLFNLLEVKPLEQITISEIARQAGIQRNTFYTYYSVPGDVLEEVMASYNQLVNQIVYICGNQLDFISLVREICLTMKKNKDLLLRLYRIGIYTKSSINLVDTTNIVVLKIFEEKNLSMENDDLKFVNRFCAGGAQIILSDWVASGMEEDVEHLVSRLGKMIDILFEPYLTDVENY